jgi:hypothetical protein
MIRYATFLHGALSAARADQDGVDAPETVALAQYFYKSTAPALQKSSSAIHNRQFLYN